MTNETKGDGMTLERYKQLHSEGMERYNEERLAAGESLVYRDAVDAGTKYALTAFLLAAQSAMRVDEEDAAGEPIRNCNVCGTPVMYGERHSRCGEAVMREVRAALQAAIGGKS